MMLGRPQLSYLGQPFAMAAPAQLQPQAPATGMQAMPQGLPQLHPAIAAHIAQMQGLGSYGVQPQLGQVGIQPLSAASVNSLR